jgi:Tfp pilus assembly PilM family ATPase
MFTKQCIAQIGLHISDHKIFAALMQKENIGWQFAEGCQITWQDQQILPALKKLQNLFSKFSKKIVIGLPNSQAHTKILSLDIALSDLEIYQYCQHQAVPWFGEIAGGWFTDFEIISSAQASHRQKQIRVFSAPKTVIHTWKTCCDQARFKLMAVDIVEDNNLSDETQTFLIAQKLGVYGH